LLKAKNPTEKAEILEQACYTALANDDTEAANHYQQQAQAARERVAKDTHNRGLAQPRLWMLADPECLWPLLPLQLLLLVVAALKPVLLKTQLS